MKQGSVHETSPSVGHTGLEAGFSAQGAQARMHMRVLGGGCKRRRACAVHGALNGHILAEQQAVQRAGQRIRVRLEAPRPPLRHLAAAERVRLRVSLHKRLDVT